MAVLICGSLAFDTITSFPGRFAQQIMPEKLHILNVSFLVPTLRREFGGCAGNIAYSLAQLGGVALPMGVLGADGADYLPRIASWGASTEHVRVMQDSFTAQCMIITDMDNNMINAFHPGAMQLSHLNPVPARSDIRVAIIAPDGRDGMIAHAEQLAAAGIPFVFDPGQQLPVFDSAELSRFVSLATWIAVNDYEGQMLCDRTGESFASMSKSAQVEGIIVTLGAQGCELWQDGQCRRFPGTAAAAIVDSTGCGDAFRGALLFGIDQGWSIERSIGLANAAGATKIAQRGGQNHKLERQVLAGQVDSTAC